MTYRVLIIGCGAIAGGYDAERAPGDWPLSHAGAVARDERFELVACVDPDEQTRDAFAKRWNVAISAASLEQLDAETGAFDLIVVTSPTGLHAQHLEWALAKRPKAVFCEKPLAKEYDAAVRLHHAFETANIPLIVNYTRRWAPDMIRLRDEVKNDEWGSLLSAAGTYSKGVLHNGSHLLDLVVMFDPCMMKVLHVGPAWADFWDDDPTASAVLTTVEGTPVHLVPSDTRDLTQFELVLNFQRGEIAIREGGMRIETRRVVDSETFAGYRTLGPVESVPGRYPEALTGAYDHLARVLSGTEKAPLTGMGPHGLCEKIRREALEKLEEDYEP